MILSVSDLELHFHCKRFAYDLTGLFILPIAGYIDAKMKNVNLMVAI